MALFLARRVGRDGRGGELGMAEPARLEVARHALRHPYEALT